MNPPSIASYERVLTAIGRYADRERWQQVCFMELEGGFLLQGVVIVATSEAYAHEVRTRVLDPEGLRALMASVGVK